MLEKSLHFIQKTTALAILLLVMAGCFSHHEAAVAATSASRRFSGNSGTLTSISLAEFQNQGLQNKISNVAALDDVRITCDVTGMSPAIVGGGKRHRWC